MESEKIIRALLRCFREDVDAFVAFEFSLQMLAWAKLSAPKFPNQLPKVLRLAKDSIPSTTEALLNIFEELSRHLGLEQNKGAFENLVPKRHGIPDQNTKAALQIALEVAEKLAQEPFDLPKAVYCSMLEKVEQLIPEEVVEVMLDLAGNLGEKKVYCPYDPLCLFASRVSKQNGDVSVETPFLSPIPWLVNILTDSNIHISISDPIREPGFLQENNLEKFDVSITFPPLGTKYDADSTRHDKFKRFGEVTSSGAVLNIRHIMAQTEEIALIAVQNSILFSRGSELALREELLKSRRLEAVITMPPALLLFTQVPFSILVINMKGQASTVKFMNGGASQFFTRDGRSRSRLTHWQTLLETFKESKDEAVIRTVSVEEILTNDAHLEVSRYILPQAQKKAEEILGRYPTFTLQDIVQFIRPVPRANPYDKVVALEVSVADFPEYGYFLPPEREVLLPESVLHPKNDKTFLRKNDILISVKGHVGKIAITPDSVPPSGKGGWVANQSCLILRIKGEIDPKVLFVYLQSELGQTLLKRLVSGATTPLIQLQALQKLRIVVPNPVEAQKVIETFDKQIEYQALIEHLKQEQKRLSEAHWKIETD